MSFITATIKVINSCRGKGNNNLQTFQENKKEKY